jgi:hypothetical protein
MIFGTIGTHRGGHQIPTRKRERCGMAGVHDFLEPPFFPFGA